MNSLSTLSTTTNPPSCAVAMLSGAVGGALVSAAGMALLWDSAMILSGGFVIPLLALTALLTGALCGAAAAVQLVDAPCSRK